MNYDLKIALVDNGKEQTITVNSANLTNEQAQLINNSQVLALSAQSTPEPEKSLYDIQLVGIDLETSGLNTYFTTTDGQRVHGALYNDILEVGIVVPHINQESGLLNVEMGHKLRVGIKITEQGLAKMDEYCLNMHTSSGLIERLSQPNNEQGDFDYLAEDVADAEQFIIHWLTSVGVEKFDRQSRSGAMVFGNTVSFDMDFINAQMPDLYSFFHYRKVDVSAVNCLARSVWSDKSIILPEKQLAHTALEDILETLSELNGYTQSI
jgi:oligoribonuclease (3'-5' exoribonuclease)